MVNHGNQWISTLDVFRQTLLSARSVTFPASTSGIYLTRTVFPRLGIASEMAAKSSNAGVTAVARGVPRLPSSRRASCGWRFGPGSLG